MEGLNQQALSIYQSRSTRTSSGLLQRRTHCVEDGGGQWRALFRLWSCPWEDASALHQALGPGLCAITAWCHCFLGVCSSIGFPGAPFLLFQMPHWEHQGYKVTFWNVLSSSWKMFWKCLALHMLTFPSVDILKEFSTIFTGWVLSTLDIWWKFIYFSQCSVGRMLSCLWWFSLFLSKYIPLSPLPSPFLIIVKLSYLETYRLSVLQLFYLFQLMQCTFGFIFFKSFKLNFKINLVKVSIVTWPSQA